MDGQLEFYDTYDMTLMNAVEHSAATDLEWDPTGRYVVTSVSFWNQKAKKKKKCIITEIKLITNFSPAFFFF